MRFTLNMTSPSFEAFAPHFGSRGDDPSLLAEGRAVYRRPAFSSECLSRSYARTRSVHSMTSATAGHITERLCTTDSSLRDFSCLVEPIELSNPSNSTSCHKALRAESHSGICELARPHHGSSAAFFGREATREIEARRAAIEPG
jgi:hypothetical protein